MVIFTVELSCLGETEKQNYMFVNSANSLFG
jgi:hypothetical protein